MNEEEAARTHKAARLAGTAVHLRASKIPTKDRPSPHDISQLTRDFIMRLHPDGWAALAKTAGVKPPSTQTIMLVVEFVNAAAERERNEIPKNETPTQRKAREAKIFDGLNG